MAWDYPKQVRKSLFPEERCTYLSPGPGQSVLDGVSLLPQTLRSGRRHRDLVLAEAMKFRLVLREKKHQAILKTDLPHCLDLCIYIYIMCLLNTFKELASWPNYSIRYDICLFVVILSPPLATGTGLTGDFWSETIW